MFTNEYKRLDTVTKALSIGRLMGENKSVYFNRIKTAIAKDRVAVSFISDDTVIHSGVFTNTVIQVVDGSTVRSRNDEDRRIELDFNRQKFDLFKSIGILNYEAAMALVYKLRIDGYIVTDIANISSGKETEFISVEELNSDSDVIKLSISDRLEPIVDTIMERSQVRMGERHTSRIISIDAPYRGLSDIIEVAINKAFKIENRYSVISESGRKYEILYGSELASVISKNTITIVSTSNEIDCNDICNALRSTLDYNDYDYRLNMTGELIMI